MDHPSAIRALQATGERLTRDHVDGPAVDLYVIGGIAGIVTHELAGDRTTADCDVMHVHPEDTWDAIAAAARAVGEELGLKDNWLNRECMTFGWQMPLGWRGRCQHLGDFGKLRVFVLSRGDLIATKVMGAPKRPQDRDDLQAMRPTPAEIDQVSAHLDRVEAESDRGECDRQRQIVEWLRRLP